MLCHALPSRVGDAGLAEAVWDGKWTTQVAQVVDKAKPGRGAGVHSTSLRAAEAKGTSVPPGCSRTHPDRRVLLPSQSGCSRNRRGLQKGSGNNYTEISRNKKIEGSS